MQNLSLDSRTTLEKVEEIEARHTPQELIKFSKDTSEIRNIIKEEVGDMMTHMINMNMDTKDKIDDLYKVLGIHFKGLVGKQEVLKVRDNIYEVWT